MTYQVLARKWRPKSFESLVGQEHVVRALTHALDGGRLHHAYLFTGTRGVGKTTLSRIFAKALNCETGVSSKPCGVCRACREIDEGRFVDYVEMDAASNRGVDEMAALLERAVYAPVDARFKVYMIDEVHMLTNHAFNAMLKTLEEPPPHVKFILATTDPQKIPVTVLSRCLQFNLKQMPAGHIVSHLEHILGEERIAFEPQALRLLSRAADGSMRDALSLTDQAIAYSANQVTEEAVRGMLGALDQSYLIRLIDALAAGDGASVLAIADEMALRSLSFSTALQDLASLLHRIAWAQFAPSSVLDEWPEAEDIRRFADMLSAEHVQLFYQIATVGRSELGLAPDEYAGFTMTLLRMLAFEPAGGPGGGGGGLAVNAPQASKPQRSAALAGSMAERAVAPAPVAGKAAGRVSATTDEPQTQVRERSVASTASASPASSDGDEASATNVERPGASRVSATRPEGDVADAGNASPAASLASAARLDDNAAEVGNASPVASLVSAARLEDNAQETGNASPVASLISADRPEAEAEKARNAPPAAPLVSATRSEDKPADAANAPPAAPAPLSAAARQTVDAAASPETAAPTPAPSRAGSGASAALEVLRSAGMRLSSDRPGRGVSAAGQASAPAAAPKPVAKPAVKVQVPEPRRPVAQAASASAPASAPAATPELQAKAAAKVVPPWEDMPPDDYAPASPEDAYFMPDDGYMPAFDSGLDDMGFGSEPAPKPAPRIDTAPLPPAVPLDALGVAVEWPALAADLPLKGVAYQLAFNSELTACDAGSVTLTVAVPMYTDAAHVAKLKGALAEKLGRAVEVNVSVGPARRTAAALDAAERAKKQQEAEQEIQRDPFVQSLIRDFGASIVQGSVRPLAAPGGHTPGASA
ncbi:DNA polymerase III subunit gamma/tau [Caballeronia sp. LZ062]|uniref:DNA polymerase III subunit gamma/tau n=1 Tax=unclassified Caballeronia TaxID=2646786 RepID=UPI00286504B7|nr:MULTISPECIES: DNA polymerase III subunit gamma/tau [unclassified Caballeronia]MDR5854685.1 DNA polymerase III subunit gamma/tau [Caballeronia sp. LZ050]MDR5870787.1 DNA polymerase III subunit gamma/tau [Caballeronia sp. LZ062]